MKKIINWFSSTSLWFKIVLTILMLTLITLIIVACIYKPKWKNTDGTFDEGIKVEMVRRTKIEDHVYLLICIDGRLQLEHDPDCETEDMLKTLGYIKETDSEGYTYWIDPE